MNILDILNSPWAIQPEKLQEISDIYARHLKGDKIDINGIEAKAGQPFDNQYQGFEVIDGVAVIPVHGVLAKRMNLFHRISGGASTELIGRDVDQAIDDDDISAIILDVDTPGGTVDGTADLGDIIYNARDQKDIYTLAGGMMASAGVWIGSAAKQTFIRNITTIVGSIGVVATHNDYSKYLENQGVKITEIYAGKYKRIASEIKPLTEEGRAVMQEQIDYFYSLFVETVARNRGVDIETVLENMADGRLFIGQQAIDAGLVDGVSTLESLIADINGESFTPFETTKAIAILETETEEADMPKNTITKGAILENAPDVAEELREEGRQEATKAIDSDKVASDAATAERERVKSVLSLNDSMPGHSKLLESLAYDGKTTKPEAAEKLVLAEGEKRTKTKEAIQNDAESISKVPASTDKGGGQTSENAPAEERAQADWDTKPEIKKEFKTLGAYVGYLTAEDNRKERRA